APQPAPARDRPPHPRLPRGRGPDRLRERPRQRPVTPAIPVPCLPGAGRLAAAVAQLFVEPGKVVRARELAAQAARGVQSFIDRHSTVAIERTVLRLLGIAGAGARGAPLASLLVDELREATAPRK